MEVSKQNWDGATLQSLITNRIEENFALEYKAAAAIDESERGKREISKDVSAFANSDGGTLIYGIREHSDPTLSHFPERIDPLSRTRFPKEWLEHVISNIRPAIPDLRIVPVQPFDDPDGVVYVVEIPKSATAHQASDLKYYKRYNFESKPMQDFEIRDIMNRSRFAKVTARATFALLQFDTEGSLHFEIFNDSEVLVRHFAAIIHAPLKWRGKALMFEDDPVVDEVEKMTALRLSFSNHLGPPLFPRSRQYRNFKCRFGTYEMEPPNQITDLRYRLYADAAPYVSGSFEIESILKRTSSFG